MNEKCCIGHDVFGPENRPSFVSHSTLDEGVSRGTVILLSSNAIYFIIC